MKHVRRWTKKWWVRRYQPKTPLIGHFVVELNKHVFDWLFFLPSAKMHYTIIYVFMCSLGIERTTFALLTECSNYWATGTLTQFQYAIITKKTDPRPGDMGSFSI